VQSHYRAKLYKGLRGISRSLKGIEKRVSNFRLYELLKFFILFFLKYVKTPKNSGGKSNERNHKMV